MNRDEIELMAVALTAALLSLPAYGQDIYTRNWPAAVEQVEYSAWAWNQRAGFRAEYAGSTGETCKAGAITVGLASEAEWDSHNQAAYIGAIAYPCRFPLWDSFVILFKPSLANPTRSLMTHELGHALGCWQHLPTSTEHIMAPLVHLWAGLTVQDVDCGRNEAHFPLYGPPDVCWTELMPNMDLIAPAAMGMYRRLKFVGDVEDQDYRWHPAQWSDSDGPECDTVHMMPGGVIALDDVRSQHWRGKAELVGDGTAWVLQSAVPE